MHGELSLVRLRYCNQPHPTAPHTTTLQCNPFKQAEPVSATYWEEKAQ